MNARDLITFIFIAIITFLAVMYGKKQFKKAKTITEKVLYILLLVIYFIPIILYYLDKWNIPTVLTYTDGMDNERWFEFISSYISTMAATIVSSVLLVLITFKQIEIQNESNNDEKRIQNAPIFKYTIENTKHYSKNKFYVNESKNNTSEYYLYLKLENIGLNHAKKITFVFKDESLKELNKFELDKSQSILKKDDSTIIKLIFNYKKNTNNKKIIIDVYYEDLLKNKYLQTIIINAKVKDNIRNINNEDLLIVNSIEVEDEIYIDEEKDVNE